MYYSDDASFTDHAASTASGGSGAGTGAAGTVGFIDETLVGGHLHVYTTFAANPNGSLTFGAMSIHDGARLLMPGTTTLTTDNLTVDTNGLITADGQGYSGRSRNSGQGPGAGGKHSSYGGGAGYGGVGGWGVFASPGGAYGAALEPVDLGSSGGAASTFYTEVGEDPARYDYSKDLLPDARRWNFERFKRAIQKEISPIVVDRGNGLNVETQQYARYAVDHGYGVGLKEPDSEWWQEICVLLKYKEVSKEILYQWADRLAELTRSNHRVPASTIRHWMDKWRHDLTIEEVLDYLSETDNGSS